MKESNCFSDMVFFRLCFLSKGNPILSISFEYIQKSNGNGMPVLTQWCWWQINNQASANAWIPWKSTNWIVDGHFIGRQIKIISENYTTMCVWCDAHLKMAQKKILIIAKTKNRNKELLGHVHKKWWQKKSVYYKMIVSFWCSYR